MTTDTIHRGKELPEIVSRDEWLTARKRLLAREKELTRERDRLSADRRRLPMVQIQKDYRFEGETGEARLLDLFGGHRQLIVYHFMFAPDWEAGCRSCSAWTDQIARGHLQHLRTRDTSFALVSRAPLDRIAPFKARMGWTFPWYSSHGSDFNYDFHVTLDESVAPMEYNYRTRAEYDEVGPSYYLGGEQPIELPGLSCFLRVDDQLFHTYSTYGRGGESVGGAHYFLDLTALGRQEPWEEPKRQGDPGLMAGGPIPYPDEYPG